MLFTCTVWKLVCTVQWEVFPSANFRKSTCTTFRSFASRQLLNIKLYDHIPQLPQQTVGSVCVIATVTTVKTTMLTMTSRQLYFPNSYTVFSTPEVQVFCMKVSTMRSSCSGLLLLTFSAGGGCATAAILGYSEAVEDWLWDSWRDSRMAVCVWVWVCLHACVCMCVCVCVCVCVCACVCACVSMRIITYTVNNHRMTPVTLLGFRLLTFLYVILLFSCGSRGGGGLGGLGREQ